MEKSIKNKIISEISEDIKQVLLVKKTKKLEDFTINFGKWLLKNYDGVKSVDEWFEQFKKK
jgi:hypothetical protein